MRDIKLLFHEQACDKHAFHIREPNKLFVVFQSCGDNDVYPYLSHIPILPTDSGDWVLVDCSCVSFCISLCSTRGLVVYSKL